MAWVEGHDGHEIDDNADHFYCRTCSEEIPKASSKAKVTIEVQLEIEGSDIDTEVGFKTEF